jgi:simple sugar transport system ATP-binding protein
MSCRGFDATDRTASVGVQQRVEILKLLYRNAKILFSTNRLPCYAAGNECSLSTPEVITREGKTILITHKLKEVMAFTDRVTDNSR